MTCTILRNDQGEMIGVSCHGVREHARDNFLAEKCSADAKPCHACKGCLWAAYVWEEAKARLACMTPKERANYRAYISPSIYA